MTKVSALTDRQLSRLIARTADRIRDAEALADRLNDATPIVTAPGDDSWRVRAVCNDKSADLFHPPADDTRLIRAALMLCHVCPVMRQCRVLRDDIGASQVVMGGVYYASGARSEDRPCRTKGCRNPAMGPQQPYCGFEHEHAAKMGTRQGYALHMKAKVPPCPSCREGRYWESIATPTGSATGRRGVRPGASGR